MRIDDVTSAEKDIRAAVVEKFGCSASDANIFYDAENYGWNVRFRREVIAEDADETWYRITGFQNDHTEVTFVAVKTEHGYDFE